MYIGISRPQKTKAKTVRIISPQSSTHEKDQGIGYGFSDPSESFDASSTDGSGSDENAEGSNLLDPFDIGSEEEELKSEDELQKISRADNDLTPSNALRRIDMPPNPFRRTLASEFEGTKSYVIREKPADPSAGVATGSKPLYDVDEFKRLLLTGERNTSHITTAQTPTAHDSSSNTDTSSISRQSIFEPLPENHQDSPRTSHEISHSEDEGNKIAQEFPRGETKLRPSIPLSHHGKPVKGNVLQTKSLQDPAKYNQNFITASGHQLKQSISQSPTDLNKPLPLPPTSAFVESPLKENGFPTPGFQQEKSSSENDNGTKKGSIRLPLSRQNSEARHGPTTTDTQRPASIIEDKSKQPESYPLNHSASGSKLPPPPPPRRHGRARGLSASSTSSAISIISTLPNSLIDDPNLKSPKVRPPLPPARTSSIKRPPRLTTNANSPSMVPPPTPPRGRGSSQSSLASLQTSGDSHMTGSDGQRNNPGASLTLSPASSVPVIDSGTTDVLADLSALQRDVDELRGKFIR